jgi:hypothetical protein
MSANTAAALRLAAYSVTAQGHILCHDEKRPDERVAVLRIDGPREIVDRLLAIVDEPRALLGRNASGAVLLFKFGRDPVPYIQGNARRDGVFEMSTRDGQKFTITCASDGTIDTSNYTWKNNRSPLEVESFRLPVLTDDIGAAVVRLAFSFATWASIVEDEQKRAARTAEYQRALAAGEIKVLTDAEREAAEDEEIAASMGNDISLSDGPLAVRCIGARKRIALRKQQRAESAMVTTAA